MEFLIRGLGFIKNIEDIENIVVKEHNGVPIYVKNLGTVSEGPDFRRGALDKAGIPATGGVVLMRYGDNPLRVIENVKAKIEELTPGLPSGVRIVPFYDRSHLIHRATDTLKETLTEEIIVAAVVILLFLGQVSSSLIIALVLPMGVLLAFVGMRIIGLPSNIMSMGGIAIAIGVMVDAGIVMTENITRHLREPHPGESKLQVATRAAKEVGPPIFFAMLIVIVAFIPVFSLTGQAGKLFKPLAYTKTFAMIGAALLAISLVPVLASVLLTDPTQTRTGTISKRVAQFLALLGWPLKKLADGITWLLRTLYRPIIRLAVKNIWTKLAVVALAGLIFAASIPLTPFYKNIGQEFMPPLNEGALLFMPVLLPGASITQAKDVMAKQDLIMNRFPEVSLVVGKLGRASTATDPAPIGMFETVINITDPAAWPRRAIKPNLTRELGSVLVQHLRHEELISEEHASHIGADFLDDIVTATIRRFDTLATTYHNSHQSVDEREKLYRIWLLRILLEELLAEGRTGEMRLEHVKIGEPETETKLHRIAEEIEPTLKHKTYFRTKNRNELIAELTEATRMPGVSPIMTQPIRNRVDMLATGIQTPIGIKVFGKDLAKIEEIAVQIEQELLKLEGAQGALCRAHRK